MKSLGKILKYFIYLYFFPITLTFLLWKWKSGNRILRASGVALIWSLVIGFAVMMNQVERGAQTIATRESVNQNTSTESETPEQRLESAIRSSLSEKTNNGQEKVRKVTVTPAADNADEYLVLVELNANSNLNENLTKTGVYLETSDVYSSLYSQESGVRESSVAIYANTVDKYGNTQNNVILRTSLDKEEAAKVNWDADSATLANVILPEVWMTGMSIFR